jgi:hypothetical protein
LIFCKIVNYSNSKLTRPYILTYFIAFMTKSFTKPVINLNNYLLSCANQIKYLTCLFILIFSSMGWGQTNPGVVFDLSSGNWTLSGWSSSVASDKYPTNGATGSNATTGVSTSSTTSNMRFWKHGSTDPLIATLPSANYTSAYSFASGTIYGNGTNGIGFNNTGGAGIGSAVLSINTIGRQDVQVSWTGRTIAIGARTYGIRLMYRIGTSGSFIDASTTASNIFYSANASISSTVMPTITLPSAVNNSETVQIMWYCYNESTITSGTRPTLGLDDITISSSSMPACSGTPVPGNTIASVNPVVSGSSTVLSLQNATAGTGVTYQWQSSPNNSTWTNVASSGTSATYTATPTANTYYRCNVICSGNTGTSNSLLVNVTYCASTGPSTQGSDYFTNFTITGGITNLNNSSTYSTNGYGDFTSQNTSQYIGSTVNFSMTSPGVSDGSSFGIFVDWNQDGDFLDTNESPLLTITQPTTNPSGIFAVPSDALIGNTRMRIVVKDATGSVLSCNTAIANSETEDYTFIVVAPTCYIPTTLTSSLITYQTATIGWTAPTSGTSPAGYYYEIRTSGAAGSGATGLVTSGSTTAPTVSESLTGLTGGTAYTYYVRSNCGGGDYSSWASATFTTLSCNVPTAVTSSSITTTTATISWTAPSGSPSGYEYEVRTSGAAGSGAAGLIATGTTTAPTVSASLTGLSASTSYSVYVRTNCYSGFNSSWTSAATLATQCGNITVFPSIFDFATYLPICWQEGDLGDLTAGPSTIGSSSTSDWVEDGFLNSGSTGSAKMNIDAANGSEWLLSSFYTIPATGFRVKYSVGATNWNVTTAVTNWEADDLVELLVSTSNTNWTVLKTYNASNVPSNLGQVDNVDISAYNGQTVRFAFRAFEGTSNGSADIDFFIDNFTIEQTPNTWIGNTSNSWSTAGNWSLNTVPTTGDNVVISSNGTNAPVLDADMTIPAGKSLTISGTGTLTIAPGKTLTIAGTADFGGKAVTFKSDATGSGMFGPLTGTLTNATNVKVERYIPAKRAYRFLSSSVNTLTTTIRQNWQEDGVNTAGFGTHITGTGGADNGFDTTATNNPSLYTFNNTSGAWEAVMSTLTNFTAGTPYRLMVRGDRTISLSTNTPNATATTLRATGTLHTGNFSPTLNQAAEGFSFVGNPYQAPVNIKTVLDAATNMNTGVVYYWDPTLNARGGYVTRDLSSNNNTPMSDFNQYLQPGQAVFVKKANTAPTATMTFTESHKAVANASAGVFRTTSPNDYGLLRVNLQANTNNQWQTIEGTLALFNDNFSWNVTSEDATKMSNLDEEVSFVQNNTSLAIACVSVPSANSELPIQLNNLRQSNYQWQFELTNYQGERPFLYDAQNNTYTEITNGVVVPFTATTAAANRFKIVFQPSALSADDFANGLVVYPNPAKAGANFYVQGITAAQVTVYNVMGQNIPVQVKSQGNALQVTPAQTLSQGIYLVTVTTEGKTQHVKWIVE